MLPRAPGRKGEIIVAFRRDRPAASRAAQALAAVLAATALASTCARLLEPLAQVHPLLALAKIDDFTSSLVDSGLIAISALPADTSYRLGPRDRIPVAITTSGRDSEAVELSQSVCGEPPTLYACRELELQMDSGYQAQQLRPVVDQIPARFILVSVSGQVAGIWVFEPASLDDAIGILSRQRGVKYVGLALIYSVAGGGGASPYLEGALPLDFARVVPHDGHVQARSGDTLTVTYDQPDRTQLTSQFLVP
jgi:hypothetical protein